MDNSKILDILINREDYNEAQATQALNEIDKLNDRFKLALHNWLENTENKEYFIIDEISLIQLMKYKRLNYLAALLTINWLETEPEIAKPIIKNLLPADN